MNSRLLPTLVAVPGVALFLLTVVVPVVALTGRALNDYLTQRSEIVDDLIEMLKVPSEQLPGRVQKLIDDNKELAKQLKSAAKQGRTDTIVEADNLLAGAEKIGATAVIVGQLSPAPIEQIRGAIDSLKKKAKSAAIVLGFAESNDKVMLLAAMTDDLVKKGLSAGEVIKAIAPIVDGGGGGRPQMAQAGGKNPAKLDEALAKATQIIKEKLAHA